MKPDWQFWTPIIVALIAATPGFLGSLYLVWKIALLHRTFNSKMDAFLELTKKASFAEGVKSEKDKSIPSI